MAVHQGSPIPGILQARTLEWVSISFSNAWKWKVKVKSLSCVWLLVTPWTAAHQAPPSMGFSRQSAGVGRHCKASGTQVLVWALTPSSIPILGSQLLRCAILILWYIYVCVYVRVCVCACVCACVCVCSWLFRWKQPLKPLEFLGNSNNVIMFGLLSFSSWKCYKETGFWISPKGECWLPRKSTIWLESWDFKSHSLIPRKRWGALG